ncbi:unnamed protein product [Linum trigynum]|uniref:Uncharacterized protein n=1 Tax=Linum trigynum TaxID=586398 RepID=A0AAV2D8U4_9ROSI
MPSYSDEIPNFGVDFRQFLRQTTDLVTLDSGLFWLNFKNLTRSWVFLERVYEGIMCRIISIYHNEIFNFGTLFRGIGAELKSSLQLRDSISLNLLLHSGCDGMHSWECLELVPSGGIHRIILQLCNGCFQAQALFCQCGTA